MAVDPIVVTHPLVQHKISLLRDKTTPSITFRMLVREIAQLMLFEATRDLALTEREIETPLERMTAPTLIITAEYDLDACRAVAHKMDAEIPDSTTVDLVGATHFMFIEEPEEVNAAMLDFLVEASSR